MMRFCVLALLVCVALTGVFADGEGEGVGILVLQKKVRSETPGLFALGTNFTVELTIYNVGDGAAYDVAVEDQWNPDDFELVDGEIVKQWPEIAAGASESFEIGLIPRTEGRFPGFRASIEYNPEAEGAEPQQGLSTSMGEMAIISQDYYAKLTDKHTFEWGIFALACGVAVGLPLLAYVDIQMNYSNGIPKKSKKE